MANNLIFVLLTNFLLAQCWQLTASAPTAGSNESQTSEREELNLIDAAKNAVQLTPRIRLLAHIVRKTSPLFMPVFDSADIFQRVLSKSKQEPLPTSLTLVLCSHVAKISTLLRRDDKLQRAIADNPQFMDTKLGQQLTAEILVEYLKVTAEFADIVQQYNDMSQHLEGDLAVKERLDNSEFPQKAVYFGELFSRLQPSIMLALERYFASLNVLEYAQESEMINWYKQLKRGVPNVQTFVQFSGFFTTEEICTVAKYYKNK